ncbi:hypothetical protein ACN4EK_30570 [Pantanalinema rosaneae CENA516]|uniref:hypothetical protein n=1 Tax=Pantanalinema rosaneae TaxID=1620701 RepID=UPI003D6F1143
MKIFHVLLAIVIATTFLGTVTVLSRYPGKMELQLGTSGGKLKIEGPPQPKCLEEKSAENQRPSLNGEFR